MQDALDAVVEKSPIVTVKDQQAFAAEQREPIDQLVLMIFALLGLALLIAVLGIVNTLALSIIERTREVGLLRAIGVSRAQLRRMVTLESVVIAVLGAVLGVVLGHRFRDRAHALAARGGPGGHLGAGRPAGDLPGRLGGHRRARGAAARRAARPGWMCCGPSAPNSATNLWMSLYHASRERVPPPHRSYSLSMDTVDVKRTEGGLKHVQVREYVRALVAEALPVPPLPRSVSSSPASASPG